MEPTSCNRTLIFYTPLIIACNNLINNRWQWCLINTVNPTIDDLYIPNWFFQTLHFVSENLQVSFLEERLFQCDPYFYFFPSQALLEDQTLKRQIEIEITPVFLVPDTNGFIDHLPGLVKLLETRLYIIVVPLIGKHILYYPLVRAACCLCVVWQ